MPKSTLRYDVDKVNCENYPNKVPTLIEIENGRIAKGKALSNLRENNMPQICLGGATWNKSPLTIKTAKSLASAKKEGKNTV